MIFIIIAVVTLVISFIVALFSLVKEQKKLEEDLPVELQSHGDKADPAVKVPAAVQTVTTPPNVETVPLRQNEPLERSAEDLKQEVPYPWKQGEPSEGSLNDTQSATEEQILSALAKMRGESGDSSSTKVEEVDSSDLEEVTPTDASVRLNGGFQVRRGE